MSATVPRWRLRQLFDAPHRLAFSAAALVLAGSGIGWCIVVLAIGQGLVFRGWLAPSLAHGIVMSLGFMPLFFTGFLFTAGPKWLERPAPSAESLLSPVLAMLAGWTVFVVSLAARDPVVGRVLGTAGIGAVAWGWLGVVLRFASMIRASTVADRQHARVVAVGCLFGVVALVAIAFGLATGADKLVRAAVLSSLWGFIGLVFAGVAHRMIPFFSGAPSPMPTGLRPGWLLRTFIVLFGVEAAAAIAQGLGIGWPHALRLAAACFELAIGAVLLVFAALWLRAPAVRLRLPAMLHLGFTWLGLAILLTGVSRLAGLPTASLPLGLAPLHAFTMGFLGSIMLAMLTRVTCGQESLRLVADDFIWRMFWVLQLAVAARLAAVALSGTAPAWGAALLSAAAIGWAGVTVGWVLRYGRRFGEARPKARVLNVRPARRLP